MIIIKIAKKMDISYDLYIRHNMPAVQWNIIAMINKNKKLIISFNRNWRHPLERKFESNHVQLL